ncbi:MAG: hypothetical protein KKG09_06700 [Verrucomicrobia bacterium]|nr:hypothetical protein [Verrucomicrobiota bacterium]MCG2681014.1 hypothetical protein [Kiritimatiellia bacterium]MBU4247794.1 hypothetical protein [Verrucomicrobiota bacterium]MBU4292082.1 hypothetical protein [Verrucomicrobiota bacterium]MBU4428912.1 hypothetical protein [Verrucomicrobiota bacterium]
MRTLHQDIGKHHAPHNGHEGSALITILGVSLILMLAGLTMVVLSSQSMHRIKRTVQTAQAQAVAEAGIADMVAKLGSNYSLWQNATNAATFLTNGIYYVRTELQTNGNVLITSDGIYMDSSNRTIMELLGTIQTHWNELYDINSAILSDGLITLATGAYDIYGNVHANSDVILANGDVYGNVSAGGTVSGSSGVTGTISNGAPISTIPPTGPFNFDSYRQMATNNGTYLEGNQTLSGNPIASPANGILYVNGTLTIDNNSSFAGTIVANGNVTIVNHFTQTSFPGSSNMPSVLSTGTIDIHNHTTLNGVMYAVVNVILRNNTTINGGVISGGYTDIRNSIEIHPGTGYPAWDPLNPEVPPEVIVGGWLK